MIITLPTYLCVNPSAACITLFTLFSHPGYRVLYMFICLVHAFCDVMVRAAIFAPLSPSSSLTCPGPHAIELLLRNFYDRVGSCASDLHTMICSADA